MEKEKIIKIIEDELFRKLAKLPANDLRLGTAQKMMELISDVELSILIADAEDSLSFGKMPSITNEDLKRSKYSDGWQIDKTIATDCGRENLKNVIEKP